MKMTMKNELKLKHGVILAAAVLLIAGIAFAGAAAADPVKVDWSETLINSTGGDFIINDLHGSIFGLYQDATKPLVLTNDLTLDFNYQTVSLVDLGDNSTESGVLGTVGFASAGKKLTIKNLIIDGGSLSGSCRAVGSVWNSSIGSIIASVPNEIAKRSDYIYLENITIGYVSLTGNSSTYGVGGFVGSSFQAQVILSNCSIYCSNITNSGKVGGIVGVQGSGLGCSHSDLSSISVVNCYVNSVRGVAGGYSGGVYSVFVTNGGFLVDNCVITGRGNTGGMIGYVNGNTLMIKNARVENSVITSTNSISAGFVSSFLDGDVRAAVSEEISGSAVDHCTIVGSNFAGGFAGTFPRTTTNYTVTVDSNYVTNSCVVAKDASGVAAGFIAKDSVGA